MPPRSKTTPRRAPAKKRGTTGRAADQRGGAAANAAIGRSNLLLGFIAGILVGGLAVALWYESQPAAEPAASAIDAKPAENKPKTVSKPKPKGPVAGNEFYEKLPTANVETFSEDKDNTPLTPYVLQTGAFRSRSDADQMEAKIVLEAGMEAWIDERVNSSGTLWYRVRVGPFEGKRATDRVKRQLWERARIEAVRYRHQPDD